MRRVAVLELAIAIAIDSLLVCFPLCVVAKVPDAQLKPSSQKGTKVLAPKTLAEFLRLRSIDDRHAARGYFEEHQELQKSPRALSDAALNYASQRWFSDALELSTRAVSLAPNDDSVLASHALVMCMCKQVASAVEPITKALRLKSSARNYAVQAEVYEAIGNPTSADVALQKALHANSSDFDVVSAQVRISKARMKSADTVKFISDYLKKHPKDLRALVLRSEIWEILGKRKQVIADLTEVVKLAPNHTFALQKLAEAYQKEGDYKSAVKTLHTLLALELNPSSEVIASNSLAKCLESMGDMQAALKAREHIVDVEQKINNYDLSRGDVKNLGSGFAKDAVEMCRLEIALKKYESAAQKLTSILTVIPENTNARELRARAYEGAGRWNDALTDWDRLVNKQSSFPKWYECRAKVYEKLGKREDARRDLATAKKLSVDP